MSLHELVCPKCGTIIKPELGNSKRPYKFEDCLRKCNKCNLGFSNSNKKPTLIYKDFKDNIPNLLTSNIEYVLNNSINKINRANKKFKFGFSTSEDALTWSFFNYFVLKNKLKELLKLLKILSNDSEYEIFLWGIKLGSQTLDTDLNNQFINQSNSFKEDKNRRTEPDVIIKLSDRIVFIEVKFRSPNDVKTDIEKYKKYLIPNINIDQISKIGLYELYRNWAFASSLSNGNRFELINLGFKKHFNKKNKIRLLEFEKIVKSNNGKFTKILWSDILDSIKESDFDSWYVEYLEKKIYEG